MSDRIKRLRRVQVSRVVRRKVLTARSVNSTERSWGSPRDPMKRADPDAKIPTGVPAAARSDSERMAIVPRAKTATTPSTSIAP